MKSNFVAGQGAPAVAGRPRWWIRQVSLSQAAVLAAVIGLIAYLALVPLGYLVWSTFVAGGTVTLAAFREAYAEAGLLEMIGNSLVFAAGSTVLSVVIGTLLAYVVVRTDVPLKPLVFAAALVPLIVPGVLYTISWIFLASPRSGFLNAVLAPLGVRPFDVFSMGGMIVVEGLHLAPLVFLVMAAAFRSLDPALEESALMSAARLPTIFRRISLPLVRPAFSAAILVMLVRALEGFEVPALLGIPDGTWVFTSRIWRALDGYPVDLGQAGAYALSLLALTALGVFLHSRLVGGTRSFETVTGKGYRPRPISLGRWRWPATALVAAYFTVAVALPVAMLVYVSTQPYYSTPSLAGVRRMTLDNYEHVLSDEQSLRAFENSLLLGVGSATAVMLVTSIAAWFVVRTRVRARWVVDDLAFLPLAVPGLVLGLALLVVYLRVPLAVYGTLWILFIAYVTRFMPYGMRYASVSMAQIGAELEESAHTSGAGWWQTFRRIVLPLLAPGLVAGWIFVLIVSLRELSSSILLYSPGNEVLAIRIWEQYENGEFPALAALGVVMVALMLVLTLLAYRIAARVGTRAA